MVLGPFVEVAVILGLLSGGTILNRDTTARFAASGNSGSNSRWNSPRASSPTPRLRRSSDDPEAVRTSDDDAMAGLGSWTWQSPNGGRPSDSASSTASTIFDTDEKPLDPTMHQRTMRFWKWRRTVTSPNTEVFKDRLLSRLLRKFPFLVEAWYWALIYWVRMATCSILIFSWCLFFH